MKLALVSFLALHLSTKISAWEVDDRCLKRRQLEGPLFDPDEPDLSLIEDMKRDATWHVVHDSSAIISSNNNLRGSDMHVYRNLEDLLVFQLRLHWEVGYCVSILLVKSDTILKYKLSTKLLSPCVTQWQEEWIEREWCLQCEGSQCQTDDYLLIESCSGSSLQRFVYMPVPDSGGGKIMPLTRPDLCWTRTRVNAHQLRKCGNDYKDRYGRDIQIIIGFEEDGTFELHPNGIDDKCMSTFPCMS